MSRPLSLLWFAQHELRLSWRDTLAMMTAGRRAREGKLAVGVVVFAVLMHAVAFMVLQHYIRAGIRPDLPTLITVTSGILLSGSALLSQAMESVTRTFYSRSDLELILSAPVRAGKLFAVRIGAIALMSVSMSVFLIGPFIDVLAWLGGARWLCAYGVLVAVSLTATAAGVVLTAMLFQSLGPKRTRLAAQIVAAVIGGAFVIGLQSAALFSIGTYSRISFLQSPTVLTHAPALHSMVWWAARAALGDGLCLAAVLGTSATLFLAVTRLYAPRFADYALLASGTSHDFARGRPADRAFLVRTASAALRRKERVLLLRDPWLLSQSLMQLLYLVPPALLLLKSFGSAGNASMIIVPVLIMASGQLAGGLAWLTISGEDAPDLVGSAPLAAFRLLRAKIEAVLQCIAVVFLPFVAALALISPAKAIIAAIGVVVAALSSAAIQFWFRTQSTRSQFRRRHTSSRIATFAEAFASITWAGAGAVVTSGNWLASVVVVLIAIGILAGVRAMSPARAHVAPKHSARWVAAG